MDGFLFNVDRHLQRLKNQHAQSSSADRCLSLLNVLMRFARNSYNAVWYLTADTPPDHHRRPNYVLAVPSINRQLLDLLFSLVYMLDDFEARSLKYQRAGWREAREEYQKFKTHFSADPAWKQHFMNLRENLELMGAAFEITPEQELNPSSIQYWKHPGELKDEQTQSRPFLRYLDKWLYADTSAQAHLSFGGLIPVAAFLVADLIGGQPQRIVEERIIQQYRFMHTSRTAVVTLAIATEIDAYLKLGYKDDALYLWRVFGDYVEEAKDMFEHRYAERLASYGEAQAT